MEKRFQLQCKITGGRSSSMIRRMIHARAEVCVPQAESCTKLHSACPVFPAKFPDMEIGIIGSGKMGAGLGRLWAKHGHYVMFSYSRRPEKLENLVLEIGSHARSGTPRDAVGFANVLFLAVPWDEVKDALSAAGVMNGKTLIS